MKSNKYFRIKRIKTSYEKSKKNNYSSIAGSTSGSLGLKTYYYLLGLRVRRRKTCGWLHRSIVVIKM